MMTAATKKQIVASNLPAAPGVGLVAAAHSGPQGISVPGKEKNNAIFIRVFELHGEWLSKHLAISLILFAYYAYNLL